MQTCNYPRSLFIFAYRSLGAYLFFYALALIPYGVRLYSSSGYIPNWNLNALPQWTSLFNFFDTPPIILCGLALLSLTGLLMMLGKMSPVLPIFCFLLYASFQNRNVLTLHPGTDVIGFLCIFMAIVLVSNWLLTWQKDGREIQIPYVLYEGAWLLLGLTFTASGISRLRGDSWVGGTGLIDMLSLMPERANIISGLIRESILSLPDFITQILTLLVLSFFLFALPLSLIKPARPYLLSGLIFCFTIILIVANMSQIIFAILLFFVLLSDVLLPYGKTIQLAVRKYIYDPIRDSFFRHSHL